MPEDSEEPDYAAEEEQDERTEELNPYEDDLEPDERDPDGEFNPYEADLEPDEREPDGEFNPYEDDLEPDEHKPDGEFNPYEADLEPDEREPDDDYNPYEAELERALETPLDVTEELGELKVAPAFEDSDEPENSAKPELNNPPLGTTTHQPRSQSGNGLTSGFGIDVDLELGLGELKLDFLLPPKKPGKHAPATPNPSPQAEPSEIMLDDRLSVETSIPKKEVNAPPLEQDITEKKEHRMGYQLDTQVALPNSQSEDSEKSDTKKSKILVKTSDNPQIDEGNSDILQDLNKILNEFFENEIICEGHGVAVPLEIIEDGQLHNVLGRFSTKLQNYNIKNTDLYPLFEDIRGKLNLTKEEFCENFEIKYKNYSGFKHGRTGPKLNALLKIPDHEILQAKLKKEVFDEFIEEIEKILRSKETVIVATGNKRIQLHRLKEFSMGTRKYVFLPITSILDEIKTLEDAIYVYKKEILPKLARILKKKGIEYNESYGPKQREINKYGYQAFLFALEKNKLKLNDIKRAIGLDIGNDKGKWDDLNLESAVKIFEKKVNPKVRLIFKKKGEEIGKDESLTVKQIRKCGFGDYISALARKNINFNSVLEGAGYDINLDWGKWKNLTLEEASEYYLKIDAKIRKLLKKDGIEINADEAITENEMRKYGYGDFVAAIFRGGFKFTEVQMEAGFAINHDLDKWNDLTLETAVQKFRNEIFPEVKKKLESENIKLLNNQAPSTSQLSRYGYGGFINALFQRNIKYSEVVRESNLKVHNEISKYENLTIKKAAKLFKSEILPKAKKRLIEIGFELKEKQAPPIRQLRNVGLGYFVTALHSRYISYNDVVESAGLVPNSGDIIFEVGRNSHVIAELIFLKHTRGKNLKSFRQIYPSKLDGNLNHCDNTIIVDGRFRRLVEANQIQLNIPENIKLINIDYTITSDHKILEGKCIKGYQGKNKILIIVTLNNSADFTMPKNAPFKENIKVMSWTEFAKFMGYEEKNLRDFEELSYLTGISIVNSDNRKTLLKLSMKSKEILVQDFSFSQKELEKDLESIGKLDLLRESFETMKLDRWVRSKM